MVEGIFKDLLKDLTQTLDSEVMDGGKPNPGAQDAFRNGYISAIYHLGNYLQHQIREEINREDLAKALADFVKFYRANKTTPDLFW